MCRWSWLVVGCAVLVLGGAQPSAAGAPMTKDQLLKLATEGVDPSVLASLVARDCVDFEVNADNVAELSRHLPKEVVKAALDCRASAVAPATPAPTVAPQANSEGGAGFGPAMVVCKTAGEGDLTPDHGKKNTCYGTLTVGDAGVSFATAQCARHRDDDDFEIAWSALRRICVRLEGQAYFVEFDEKAGPQHRLKLDPSIPWADQAWADSYDKRKTDCEAQITGLLARVREHEPQVETQVRCP